MRLLKHIILLIFTACLLTGCGFHLRAPIALPPSFQTVYIQSDSPYNDLSLQLRLALNDAGAKTLSSSDNAQINLVILNENQTQVITSIASNSQVTIEIVTYTVKFQVTDANNQVLLGPRKVSVSRTYSQNSNELLSVTNDLNILLHDMRSDIVRQILDQITARNALLALDVSDT